MNGYNGVHGRGLALLNIYDLHSQMYSLAKFQLHLSIRFAVTVQPYEVRMGLPISWAPHPWVVSTTVLTLVRESTSCVIASGVIEVMACVNSWSLLGGGEDWPVGCCCCPP